MWSGLRDDNWTDLGECKWGVLRIPGSLEAELEGKLPSFPNNRGATLNHRFFVRRKPAARADAEGWYSLHGLYAMGAGECA